MDMAQQQATEMAEKSTKQQLDGQRVDAADIRMALDRLLLQDGRVAAVSSTAGPGEEDSTDSSSLSSHSSTLKGSSGSSRGGRGQQPRPAERMNVANFSLGDQGPAPPSPRSAQAPMEGLSTEDTLRKLSIDKNSTDSSSSELNSRMITCRTPRDFFFIKVLGEGSFSTVYYAKEVDTADEYAIKVLLKSEIRREGRVRYVLREKDIMAALTYAYGGHPFICGLYCTFQDNDRLYFALAYAKHGELLDWLRRLGSFDEEATLFYASEILSALEFLHRCNVIHRDLKPENILVGSDWHILVSDFGTSKLLDGQTGPQPPPIEPLPPGEVPGVMSSVAVKPTSSSKRGVRSSFVGTAHYISPEVLKSEDVGPECDYWALGAIIFQMISGQPPFRAVNEYKIMRKILNLDFHFPDGFPEVAKDLVTRLLVYKPSERLGSSQNGGIHALKGHPFFKGVDWEEIFTRKPPELKPYLPASCGEPAFYGDYKPPAHTPTDIEPGLNEAALSRLMGLGGDVSAGCFTEFEFGGRHGEDSSTPASSSSSSYGSTPTSSCTEGPSMPGRSAAAFGAMFPTALAVPSAEELERRRQFRLEQQRRDHKYHRFVQDNLILKAGLIDKKKGLFARRRMFLLTEGPRLFYVDPVSMHLKGEVPFSGQLRTEAKNFRTFFVHTPKRTYYLFDPERHAKDWCDAIDWAREKYFDANASPDLGLISDDMSVHQQGGQKKEQKRAKSPATAVKEERRSRPGSAAEAKGGGGRGGLIGRAKTKAVKS